ncbi:nucleotidyltransferase domain-containing protein [Bacillus sp. FJAT-45350]|uniref:nucleotidyltransferase domain-containing protein n=1 Tax=Bacillus sp. FJAT-45350 TaxID=2011014 RepID=UPI001C5420C1|nr:nucleotidyltransferase domain-containing protein [Bacillus sp. FJAT-45350]
MFTVLLFSVEQALVFGSRAMGNYKKGSDVDLAIVGDNISQKVLFELNDLLKEEYPLPYFCHFIP